MYFMKILNCYVPFFHVTIIQKNDHYRFYRLNLIFMVELGADRGVL